MSVCSNLNNFSEINKLLPQEGDPSTSNKGRWVYIKDTIHFSKDYSSQKKKIEPALKRIDNILQKFINSPLSEENIKTLESLRKLVNKKVVKYKATHNFLYLFFSKLIYGNVDSYLNRINKKIDEMIGPDLFPEFQNVSEKEILALQSKVQNTNDRHPLISLKDLKEKNRLPCHKLKLDNVTYYCSNPFVLQEGESNLSNPEKNKQLGTLALIEIDGNVYPRMFFLSRSQATWRCMPAAEKKPADAEGNKRVDGYVYKGRDESEIQLPIALNIALQNLPVENLQDNENYFQHDMVRTIDKRELRVLVPDPQLFSSIDEVSRDQKVEEEDLPNFSKIIKEYEFDSPQYGHLKAKVYLAKNRKAEYLFYENEAGHAFLAAHEIIKDNPLNSYGLRRRPTPFGKALTPLLEYKKQVPQQFHPRNTADNPSNYISSWNLLKTLDIIQRYYKEQNRELPGEV